MTQFERDDPHTDLGGNIPKHVSIESMIAIVDANLGSDEMRRAVEKHRAALENDRQRLINTHGANLVRLAGVKKPEEPQGIDTQPILDDWEEYAKKHQETSQ
jgi:hypothetical protein